MEYVVQNPPSKPLSMEEMDQVYGLPYMRSYHPSYEEAGGVPAVKEIQFSLISNRGCFGACSFCALTFHQGRIIQARSHESLVEEGKKLTEDLQFKGYIHDVGGPTANFRLPACEKQKTKGTCKGKQCLYPKPCQNLQADHQDYIKLLKKLRALPKVKNVFIIVFMTWAGPCIPLHTYGGVRGQLYPVSSPFPPLCGFWESNSGHRACST